MGEETPGAGQTGSVITAVVRKFLSGPRSVLVIMLAGALGLAAIVATPREEEPQIVVPMADVLVDFPGHCPAEVEQLVTTPLERLLSQIEGVEHVYSVSRRDECMVTVRFYVGEDRDRSMVKLRDKINAHPELVPPGVRGWYVRPVSIDDVPIVTLTFFSGRRDGYALRRLAEEMKARLDRLEDISSSEVFGGSPREVTIEPDAAGMAARGVVLEDILQALARSNLAVGVGAMVGREERRRLVVGPALAEPEEIGKTVLFSRQDRMVRLEDVAAVRDGPAEPEDYVHIGFGPASEFGASSRGERLPAVTLAFSKKRGTNAVGVAARVLAEVEALKGELLPDDVEVAVTRNYGATADEKVNELLRSMVFAVLTVVGLMAIAMGWREALVVGLAVPVSFALALFVNLVFGYTINRVTLFALILSLGLVVDDPITNVDNIQRHIRMGLEEPFGATLSGVREVIPPVIMSTLTIIL